MTHLNRVVLVTIGIYGFFGLFYNTVSHAESKSEMIKRLRSTSCINDVSRTEARVGNFQQLQTEIIQLLKQMENISPEASFINQVKTVEATLTNLVAALTKHNLSKQDICERLNPGSGTEASYPQGYEGLSKSDRIGRLKTDFCEDSRQNGEPIRKEISALKEAMKTILKSNPPDESLDAPTWQARDQWSQMIPIVDNLYNERTIASNLCNGIEQGISKSGLICISKQSLESGGQLPFFYYLITYN